MIFQEKIKSAIANSNLEEFNFKEFNLLGEICILVNPKNQSVTWNKFNKYLRSVIYRKSDFAPISLGFYKFPNWGEKEDIFPLPKSLITTKAVLKLDGSCLLVSFWKGLLILRTRGSTGIEHLLNYYEVEAFKKEYPRLFSFGDNIANIVNYTLVFEWTSPTNQIVIKYNKPELYLIGGISHDSYELFSQDYLDFLAKSWGLKRPEIYKFNSISNMIEVVKNWDGKEGIVLYSGNDQILHKIKSLSYLKLHYFKGNATLDNTIELFFQYGKPDFNEFQERLKQDFDFECSKMVLPFCSKIVDAYKEVSKIIQGFKYFIDKNKNLTRKQIAVTILASYGKTERSSMIFTLLDGRDLDERQLTKLLWQCLKK